MRLTIHDTDDVNRSTLGGVQKKKRLRLTAYAMIGRTITDLGGLLIGDLSGDKSVFLLVTWW